MSETALVLRVCRADMTSHSGFVWPSEIGAEVVAPDWIANDECGNGLHGWLYGHGDHLCVDHWRDDGAKWLVLEVLLSSVVMLGGKCKFEKAAVQFIGDKYSASAFIRANEPRSAGVVCIGESVIVGDRLAATVGALGMATAGNRGTATAGNYGTATAGDFGMATAGYSGTATAGYSGTATAGNSGTATAGNSGEIRIRYYDNTAERYRTKIAYVGEDGIKANTPYKLNDKHEFAEVEA